MESQDYIRFYALFMLFLYNRIVSDNSSWHGLKNAFRRIACMYKGVHVYELSLCAIYTKTFALSGGEYEVNVYFRVYSRFNTKLNFVCYNYTQLMI